MDGPKIKSVKVVSHSGPESTVVVAAEEVHPIIAQTRARRQIRSVIFDDHIASTER